MSCTLRDHFLGRLCTPSSMRALVTKEHTRPNLHAKTTRRLITRHFFNTWIPAPSAPSPLYTHFSLQHFYNTTDTISSTPSLFQHLDSCALKSFASADSLFSPTLRCNTTDSITLKPSLPHTHFSLQHFIFIPVKYILTSERSILLLPLLHLFPSNSFSFYTRLPINLAPSNLIHNSPFSLPQHPIISTPQSPLISSPFPYAPIIITSRSWTPVRIHVILYIPKPPSL